MDCILHFKAFKIVPAPLFQINFWREIGNPPSVMSINLQDMNNGLLMHLLIAWAKHPYASEFWMMFWNATTNKLFAFQIKHEYLRSHAYMRLSLSSPFSSSPVTVTQIWPLSRYSCCYLGSLHPRNFILLQYSNVTWSEWKCISIFFTYVMTYLEKVTLRKEGEIRWKLRN